MKEDKTCGHLENFTQICKITGSICALSPGSIYDSPQIKPVKWESCPAYNLPLDLVEKVKQARSERSEKERAENLKYESLLDKLVRLSEDYKNIK